MNVSCSKCKREFTTRQAFNAHFGRTHIDRGRPLKPTQIVKQIAKKRVAWNKGLTKETTPLLAQISNTIKMRIASGEIKICGGVMKDETKQRLRAEGRLGGYRKGSGHGKSGSYKGIWCDSSWELAFVLYNIDHGVAFSRCKEKFPYVFEGKTFHYHPDFVVEGKYVEIKGWFTEKTIAKLAQFRETGKQST